MLSSVLNNRLQSAIPRLSIPKVAHELRGLLQAVSVEEVGMVVVDEVLALWAYYV